MPPYARLETTAVILQRHQPSKKSSDPVASRGLRLEDFKPITTLGRGNMGTVLLVALRADSTNLPLAMKVIKKDTSRKHKMQRSQLEKDILSGLNHPFLPSLYAHFESDKHTFLLTEFCSGGDHNVLRHNQPEKRFSEAAVRFYGAEVLLALEHLHKFGVVYRDLKPENILIQETGHIMLTDFDLSLKLEGQFVPSVTMQRGSDTTEYGKRNPKSLFSFHGCLMPRFTTTKLKNEGAAEVGNDAATTREFVTVKRAGAVAPIQQDANTRMRAQKDSNNSGEFYSFVGTEEYVAPEILWGTRHGFPVDWWTFGIFLYELVYGTTPFKSSSRKETFVKILTREPELPGASSPLKDLIKKLLVKDPIQRLGTSGGADELKGHKFFEGVRWESLEEVFRPPFVPSPFSLIECENKMEREKPKKAEAEKKLSTESCSNSDGEEELGPATMREIFKASKEDKENR